MIEMEYKRLLLAGFLMVFVFINCSEDKGEPEPIVPVVDEFYYGADLSYVNQIVDHDGVFRDSGIVELPYNTFKQYGTKLVRFRLWHNPAWTKEVYGASGTQLYNDLNDVEKSIKSARDQGLEVLLDFHYSDSWADPGKQEIPAAWKDIKSISVLGDSVYNYTYKTLMYLDSKNLLPEFVQVGNETNCGVLYTNASDGFPACNVCNGSWSNAGIVFNKAIDAIRDVSATSPIKTKVILHVADPKNVDWWFDNMKAQGVVTDFDIVGFSYYPLWHNTVSLSNLSGSISAFKSKYKKDVMILETAYPWTTAADDSYNNLFGSQTAISGFPFTKQGQLDIMKELVKEVKDGGGVGVIYWEPAWISSQMKDLWGTGSAWENSAFYDFEGNTLPVINYPK
jgi:arabinogalactan endo-1,4-beta-galactosidase